MLSRDPCHVLTQAPGTNADDLAPHADAVGARHRCRRLEPPLEAGERAVHVRVQRQFALDHQRRDQDYAGTMVGSEAAGEVERVLGLLAV
ncbi:MAG TPA: hypothetical protein VJ838_12470 [Gaiellaceae bacterium]|nr:hypothetical protein [Gaiellaceae bacterium]